MEFGWIGPWYLYPGGLEVSNFTISLAFGYFWSTWLAQLGICHAVALFLEHLSCNGTTFFYFCMLTSHLRLGGLSFVSFSVA